MSREQQLENYNQSDIVSPEEFEKISASVFSCSENFNEFKSIMLSEGLLLNEQELIEEYNLNREGVDVC